MKQLDVPSSFFPLQYLALDAKYLFWRLRQVVKLSWLIRIF